MRKLLFTVFTVLLLILTGCGSGMRFKIAGNYLEYNGGTTLYHYDKDYYLLETLRSEGDEVIWDNTHYRTLVLDYTLSGLKDGEEMSITIKHFRPTRHFEFDLR